MMNKDQFGQQVGQLRNPQPLKQVAGSDLRERESRLRHALEVIRDAEGLDAKALQTIALAVIGPRPEAA